MSPSNSTNNFGMNCPSGGDFHACSSKSLFVGCCASDPCSNDCPAGNLKPTGFAVTKHGNMTDASCPMGSQFYTCVYDGKTPDTFWGCCKSNPCATGSCPSENLAGAFLGTPAQLQAYAGLQSSPSPTASSSSGSSINVAAIAGGAAGGGVAILLLLGLLIVYIRRAKKAKTAHAELEKRQSQSPFAGAGAAEKRGSGGYGQHDSPPMYTSPQPSPQPGHAPTFSPNSPHPQWQHQHQHHVSELPAAFPITHQNPSTTKSPHEHRFSELPASGPADSHSHAQSSGAQHDHCISELPSEPVRSEQRAENAQPSELESLMPQSPPRSPGMPHVVSPLLSSAQMHGERGEVSPRL
ncbi:hypothetical protein B0J11DRAFT_292448 [Dendryphion nanum]|uniref:Uncharacterized protein n=1 Tax=Dendryphion nanum TaxID=256645 RepID=A0A9P9DXY0_9PLEO|nr:hypothetical protein B0J11DRAFT_292448 [Dendryphion nanum]